jgi:hypothetical protein
MKYLPLTICALSLLLPTVALAQDDPHILFIRGAERSGGFYEGGGDAARTEQLADINNASTSGGNHGWATLAGTLRDNGFTVSQMIEPLAGDDPDSGQTEGAPIDFASMDLSEYDAIVFGSNNATYNSTQADAIEAYLRGGGGAVFISDANFGDDWADASDSDQPFLDRLGLVANQDRGEYSLFRDEGDFLMADHPILTNVDRFDGEGVTPVTVLAENLWPEGVEIDILAVAQEGLRRNDNDSGNQRGSEDSPTDRDAVLAAGTIDDGRFVWHFDRNTFFNQNGAGTNINRFDNEQLAINLMEWVSVPEPTSAAALAPAALLMGRRR